MRELFKAVEKLNGARKLTRVHVHTLAYQAIVTVKGMYNRHKLPNVHNSMLI